MNWFWSVTLYDTETTAMYPNPLERYSIGDRTKGIKFEDNGSLTLTLGHTEPEDKANWLPAPEGEFYLILRLYGVKPDVVTGKWTPPPGRKSKLTQVASDSASPQGKRRVFANQAGQS